MFLEGSLLVDHSFYFHLGHRSAVTEWMPLEHDFRTRNGANTCKDTCVCEGGILLP